MGIRTIICMLYSGCNQSEQWHALIREQLNRERELRGRGRIGRRRAGDLRMKNGELRINNEE